MDHKRPISRPLVGRDEPQKEIRNTAAGGRVKIF
nr:MAG TPA: hypothetical protein [Caudoviricetes sp.]